MNRVKLQVSVLKSFISRNEAGATRLKNMYKRTSVNDKLNENQYTYEA